MGAFFRSCAVCHLSAPPIFWICSYCHKKLQNQFLPIRDRIRQQNDNTHIRLLDWRKDNHSFIGSFIYSLKNQSAGVILSKIALELSYSYIYREEKNQIGKNKAQKSSIYSSSVLVPAPPSQNSKKKTDHAFHLAEKLSSVLKIPVQTLNLQNLSVALKQKQMAKTERKKRRFIVQNANLFLDKKIIFIDDVLTTGATARAVYLALNKPKNFLILTLAWRSDYYASR